MDWMCLAAGRTDITNVRMVMQTVYLYDQIVITKTKQPGVKAETNLFYLPVDENNLACRAAKMLIDEFNITEGVHISMDKKIPVSAGMAGGSADAAAVLFGVNKMFGLGLSMTELEERGVKLGADVPYCLMRGTVLAEGIGEKLTPLLACPKCFVLLAKPPISVSTKMVYEKSGCIGNYRTPGYRWYFKRTCEKDIHKDGRVYGKCTGAGDDSCLSGH